MQNRDTAEKLSRLPDEDQDEVTDFVDFLLSGIPEPPDASQVLRETSGIWKGEADSITYENALREQWKRGALDLAVGRRLSCGEKHAMPLG